MSNCDNQRVSELEIKLTFLDDTVSALSSADAEQAQQLRRIERSLSEMRAELHALRLALGHDARDEPPPPHY